MTAPKELLALDPQVARILGWRETSYYAIQSGEFIVRWERGTEVRLSTPPPYASAPNDPAVAGPLLYEMLYKILALEGEVTIGADASCDTPWAVLRSGVGMYDGQEANGAAARALVPAAVAAQPKPAAPTKYPTPTEPGWYWCKEEWLAWHPGVPCRKGLRWTPRFITDPDIDVHPVEWGPRIPDPRRSER